MFRCNVRIWALIQWIRWWNLLKLVIFLFFFFFDKSNIPALLTKKNEGIINQWSSHGLLTNTEMYCLNMYFFFFFDKLLKYVLCPSSSHFLFLLFFFFLLNFLFLLIVLKGFIILQLPQEESATLHMAFRKVGPMKSKAQEIFKRTHFTGNYTFWEYIKYVFFPLTKVMGPIN